MQRRHGRRARHYRECGGQVATLTAESASVRVHGTGGTAGLTMPALPLAVTSELSPPPPSLARRSMMAFTMFSTLAPGRVQTQGQVEHPTILHFRFISTSVLHPN